MDWSGCNEVEQVPGRVSGAPVLKHSRVFADSIVENYEDGETPESLADMFEVPLEQVRAVLDFAFSRKTTYFENARKPGGGALGFGTSAIKNPASTICVKFVSRICGSSGMSGMNAYQNQQVTDSIGEVAVRPPPPPPFPNLQETIYLNVDTTFGCCYSIMFEQYPDSCASQSAAYASSRSANGRQKGS